MDTVNTSFEETTGGGGGFRQGVQAQGSGIVQRPCVQLIFCCVQVSAKLGHVSGGADCLQQGSYRLGSVGKTKIGWGRYPDRSVDYI